MSPVKNSSVVLIVKENVFIKFDNRIVNTPGLASSRAAKRRISRRGQHVANQQVSYVSRLKRSLLVTASNLSFYGT